MNEVPMPKKQQGRRGFVCKSSKRRGMRRRTIKMFFPPKTLGRGEGPVKGSLPKKRWRALAA